MAKYLKKEERKKAIQAIRRLSSHLKKNYKLYEEVLDFFTNDKYVKRIIEKDDIESVTKDINESIRNIKIIIRRSEIFFNKVDNYNIKNINSSISEIKNMFLSYKNDLDMVDDKITEINNEIDNSSLDTDEFCSDED